MQRHRLPPSANWMSSSVGVAFSASKARAAMIMPGVQKPHWTAPASSLASTAAVSRESGSGGAEAQKVREMVGAVEKMEYESDVLQRGLLRELLSHEDDMSYGDFFLWTRVVRQIARIGDRAARPSGGR